MIFSCRCCCFLKSLKSAILTALVLVTGRCFDSDWQNITRKNVATIFRQSLEQQPQNLNPRLLHVTAFVKNRVLAVVNWFRALLELTCDQAVLFALATPFAFSRKKMADLRLGGSQKCKLKLIQVNHFVCIHTGMNPLMSSPSRSAFPTSLSDMRLSPPPTGQASFILHPTSPLFGNSSGFPETGIPESPPK